MEEAIIHLEHLFLGLGDKTRLRLIALMADGPVSVGYLVSETGESQPKVSRHLAYLRHVGLVETRRDGKWIYYAVAPQVNEECEAVLSSVIGRLTGRHAEPRPASRRRVPALRIEEEDVIPPYEPYEEPAAEWEDRSDDRRDELEIFLL